MKFSFLISRVIVPALLLLYGFPSAFASTVPQIPCDIQTNACSLKTADGTLIEFDIQPKPVVVMRERTFMVRLTRHGASVDDAEVGLDLTMPGMYMGKNTPLMKHVSGGRYEGTGVIMRCPSGKKVWRATVSVTSKKKPGAAFLFEVK